METHNLKLFLQVHKYILAIILNNFLKMEVSKLFPPNNMVLQDIFQGNLYHNQLISDSQVIREDSRVIREDSQVIREDSQVIKEDSQVIKEDSQVIKEDFQVAKEDFQVAKEDFKEDQDFKEDKDFKVSKEDFQVINLSILVLQHKILGHQDQLRFNSLNLLNLQHSLILPQLLCNQKYHNLKIRLIHIQVLKE